MKEYDVSFEIEGDFACWTRPDTGDGFTSYAVPTRSGIRGCFQQILFSRKVIVKPVQVDICSIPNFCTITTNYRGPHRKTGSKNTHQIRQTVLSGVCYKCYAKVVNSGKVWLNEKAQKINAAHAYEDIFKKNLKRGRFLEIPFLGIRDYLPRYVGPIRESTKPANFDMKIQKLLYRVFGDAPDSGLLSESEFRSASVSGGVMEYDND